MKVTIIPDMLLLTEQEKQQADAYYRLGLQNKSQGNAADAAGCYREAAKLGHLGSMNNLAILFYTGEGVTQDSNLAFQLMLDAARHGNVISQLNVGRWYLSGTIVYQDTDLGLAWLSAAADEGNTKACVLLSQFYQQAPNKNVEQEIYWRRRGARMGDPDCQAWMDQQRDALENAYRRSLDCSMPPQDRLDLSRHTELYQQSWSLPGVQLHDGKLYYLSKRDGLCVSNPDGSDARLLFEKADRGHTLAISSGHIFLYTQLYEDGRDFVELRELSLDGRLVRTHILEDVEDGVVSKLYIVGDTVYYPGSRDGDQCPLYAYNTQSQTRSVIYGMASEIHRLYASPTQVVFEAVYEYNGFSEKGWMCLNLETGAVRCLSSTLSPELLITRPECFDEDSFAYEDNCVSQKIFAVDLTREQGILWVERQLEPRDGSPIYLEPRSLLDPWGEALQGMPVWRFTGEDWNHIRSGQVYFDGDRMFCAPDYYHFYGVTRDGTPQHWNLSNGHGECEQFCVVEDLLLLDVDAYGEKVYRASPQPSPPLRDSWRNELPAPEEPVFAPLFTPLSLEPLQGAQAEPPASPDEALTAPESGGASVPPCKASIPVPPGDPAARKDLTSTDVKYGILTLGSKFPIGTGVPVTVCFHGSRYAAKTHNTSKGRVDGLRKLFTDHGLQPGQTLEVWYDPAENTIYLSYAAE